MRRRLLLIALTALLLLSSMAIVTNGYELSWWTVDGGGSTFSTGGAYTLGGTLGQPDAGLMTGGAYTLGGGFWGGGQLAAPSSEVYLPVIRR